MQQPGADQSLIHKLVSMRSRMRLGDMPCLPFVEGDECLCIEEHTSLRPVYAAKVVFLDHNETVMRSCLKVNVVSR